MDNSSGFNWSKLLGLRIGTKFKEPNLLNKRKITRKDREKIYAHNNFEDLAIKFIRNITNKHGWKKTPWQGDANHDGYIIIGCYKDNLKSKEEWWFEAKFTYGDKKKNISRYKLDATIVSAILSNANLSQIFFVTNFDIEPSVITDISFALSKAIHCNKVQFFTRNFLEYWLLDHNEILKDFFNFTREEISFFKKKSHYFVSSPFEVVTTNNILFLEPCYSLYLNKIYCARFCISTTENTSLIIIPDNNIVIDSIFPDFVEVGATPISIYFHFNNKPTNQDIFSLFTVNNVPIFPYQKITVLDNDTINLNISAQIHIEEEIIKILKKYEKTVVYITGKSGTGKTHLLEKIAENNKELMYLCTFSNDEIDNIKRIFLLVLFIIFPYINPKDIDLLFLSNLKKHNNLNIISALYDLMRKIHSKNSQQVKNSAKNFTHEFPSNINKKFIIFLDDVHKIYGNDMEFLNHILHSIYKTKINIIFIMCGQENMISEESVFLRHIDFKRFDCEITFKDVVENLKHFLPNVYKFQIENIVKELLPNVVILKEYIQYVSFQKQSIKTFEDFMLSYSSFINSGQADESIVRKFQESHSIEKRGVLLNQIYYSKDGIVYESRLREYVDFFLNLQLVKINQNTIVYIHDTYRSLYLKRYKKISPNRPQTLEENYQDILLSEDNFDIIRETAKKVNELRYTNFPIILYILEPVFRSNKNERLQNILGDKLYFNLYFTYAYACVNQSVFETGLNAFKILYDAILTQDDAEYGTIKIQTLYEIINLYFVELRYDKAIEYYNLLENYFQKLIIYKYDTSQEILFRFLAKHIKIYICTANGENTEEQFLEIRQFHSNIQKSNHHYIEFTRRYADYLMHSNIEKAYKHAKEAYNMYLETGNQDEKLKLLLKFQSIYIDIVKNNQFTYLNKLENITNQYKESLYNNYLRSSYGIALLFYAVRQKDKGNKYFSINMLSRRYISIRDNGFRYQTIAMYYLNEKNPKRAIKALKKSLQYLKNISSYAYIIEHNIEVIEKGNFDFDRIRFCASSDLDENFYYIDPRIMH
jgi:uridine kinase